MKLKKMLSTAEAASALGVSTQAVQQRIHRGDLPAEKIGGRWFIAVDDLHSTPDRRRRYDVNVVAIADVLDITPTAVRMRLRKLTEFDVLKQCVDVLGESWVSSEPFILDTQVGRDRHQTAIRAYVRHNKPPNERDLLRWVIFEYLSENPGSTQAEIAEATGIRKSRVRSLIFKIDDSGYLLSEQGGKLYAFGRCQR